MPKVVTLTLINPLALVNNPNVVCLDASPPTGTKSFNFSRQCLRWALLQTKAEQNDQPIGLHLICGKLPFTTITDISSELLRSIQVNSLHK